MISTIFLQIKKNVKVAGYDQYRSKCTLCKRDVDDFNQFSSDKKECESCRT
jgi:rRNA maturation endonuclease Nob1